MSHPDLETFLKKVSAAPGGNKVKSNVKKKKKKRCTDRIRLNTESTESNPCPEEFLGTNKTWGTGLQKEKHWKLKTCIEPGLINRQPTSLPRQQVIPLTLNAPLPFGCSLWGSLQWIIHLHNATCVINAEDWSWAKNRQMQILQKKKKIVRVLDLWVSGSKKLSATFFVFFLLCRFPDSFISIIRRALLLVPIAAGQEEQERQSEGWVQEKKCAHRSFFFFFFFCHAA